MDYESMICGMCRYHKQENLSGEWVCTNPDGEYFGMESLYDEHCPDWEEKNT